MRHRTAPLLALAATALHALAPACALDVDEGLTVEVSVRAGAEIELDEAWLHLESLVLVPCEDTDRRAFRWWAPARAAAHHAGADGLSLDAAHVIDVGAGARTILGALRPPPGRYCAVGVVFSPASADADGFVEEMDGWTLVARRGDVEARAFGTRAFEVPLEAPLVMDRDRPAAAVTLTFDLARGLAATPDSGADPLDRGLDLLVALPGATTASATP